MSPGSCCRGALSGLYSLSSRPLRLGGPPGAPDPRPEPPTERSPKVSPKSRPTYLPTYLYTCRARATGAPFRPRACAGMTQHPAATRGEGPPNSPPRPPKPQWPPTARHPKTQALTCPGQVMTQSGRPHTERPRHRVIPRRTPRNKTVPRSPVTPPTCDLSPSRLRGKVDARSAQRS